LLDFYVDWLWFGSVGFLTPPARPVTAAEISAFLHHLTQLRSPAHTDDQAKRAAVLAHKAELFDRIADQHTGPDQAHVRCPVVHGPRPG
jgi:hypothetical protein